MRGRRLSPINSVKHIVQTSLSTVTNASVLAITIANAAQDAVGTNALQVQVGSTISAVYIEMWLIGDQQTRSTANVMFEKAVNNKTPMTFGESQALHTYTNKNNLFHVTQGLVGAADTNPTPFLRGWFKIPKGKQTMRLGDKLVLNIAAITDEVEVCGTFIYKTYS